MYKIKQIPEDFTVREINELKLGNNGNYSYFLLKKRNYNTLRAVKIISQKLKINEKNIGFAGNKDKNAVTEQIISIKNGNKNIENIASKDIELKFIGQGNKEIFLGSHIGNEFEITIRNLANKETANISKKIKNNEILMPNFFGPQRFSNNNSEIGKAIIKKDFKKAVELIIETNSDFKNEIIEHLEKKPNDFVAALKIIPLKLLKLYVHSYQSFLFNKTLEKYAKTNRKTLKNSERIFGVQKNALHFLETGNKLCLFPSSPKISKKFSSVSINKNYNYKNIEYKNNIIRNMPIVGFGTELGNNEMGNIIRKIMEEEKINERDFIIRQIPELSSEGIDRDAFIKVKDFKIIKKEKDELNKNKEKLIVRFSLPKGCYATVLIESLFG